jgi:hypothetical protein
MKTLWVTVVGILLISTSVCHSQATAYPISLKDGIVRLDQSGITTAISIGKRWLVGPNNLLVLVVDVDNHQVRLDNVDSDTNLVAVLAESTRCSLLTNGNLYANLEFSDLTVSNGLFSATGDGVIMIHGSRATDPTTGDPVNFTGGCDGVLNDSVNGNTDEPDIVIKATVKPAGRAFNADDFGL